MSVLAACVAALLVVAHAAALLHYAIVAHGVCDEHGHLVHAGESAGEHTEEASAPLGAAALRSDEASHDHCLNAARPAGEFLVPAPQLVATDELTSERERLSSLVAVARDSAALLLLAPKQSPPV